MENILELRRVRRGQSQKCMGEIKTLNRRMAVDMEIGKAGVYSR